MTLGFKTAINDKPTFFVEKIIKAFDGPEFWLRAEYYRRFPAEPIAEFTVPAKIHTIRPDKPDRWRAGNDIHFVVKNRTPERFMFLPVMECINTQRIAITHDIWKTITIDGLIFYSDFKLHSRAEEFKRNIERLAINDGFDSVEDFWAYFSEDFEGKIIHWTGFEY